MGIDLAGAKSNLSSRVGEPPTLSSILRTAGTDDCRAGVFEKVQAFAKSAKGHLLNEYKSHFLDAIVSLHQLCASQIVVLK